MTQRDKLLDVLSLALASAAALSAGAVTAQAHGEGIECYGINTCKGTNGCAVGKLQIKAANEVFSHKFDKSATADCSGTTECAAKSGHLAWVSKASNDECFKADGFVFDKDKKGNFVVRTKAGVQKAKT